eukprot:m.116381 g.116381  ORF g.116381 m.116381 type:complete len:126 (-) comp12851_c2_seq10:22-399(-)
MKSSAMNISACHGLCYFNLVLDTADINNLPSTPIERATLACEKGTELGLPMLLSPADLIADHLDDISATTFVAELREDYDVAKENAPAPPKVGSIAQPTTSHVYFVTCVHTCNLLDELMSSSLSC